MKFLNLIMFSMVLCLFSSCTDEQLNDQDLDSENLDTENTISSNTQESTSDEHCVTTTLIAGQHYDAGIVTVDIDGDNLIVTFTSNGEWSIGTTHLSLGNCDEDWAPLTGSGNPQIGQFEFTEPYSETPYEVVYIIPTEGLDDNYCFAAHAEVVGPEGNGETAWAEGAQFDGNSWAMFVESSLSECEGESGGGNNVY